ncbi:MAG: hypothetical protein M3065_03325, partial [Actinomycetota bacterium]|nr:hypothetical protein [Actinomycetota bacterium]
VGPSPGGPTAHCLRRQLVDQPPGVIHQPLDRVVVGIGEDQARRFNGEGRERSSREGRGGRLAPGRETGTHEVGEDREDRGRALG